MSPLPAGARWSDAALRLFEATGETAVSAGAGSGKTTALLELLTRRLAGIGPAEPIAPGEVVAITFTERAGAELMDRLGEELAHGIRELRAGGDAVRADRLVQALRELPSMSVGTIHGYAAKLLRLHPLEAGVDPDFAVLEEEGAQELLSAAALGGAVAALDREDAGCRRLAAAMGGVRPLAGSAAALVRERSTRGAAGSPLGVRGDPEAVERARGELLDAASEMAAMAGAATTATGRQALADLGARLVGVQGAERLRSPWDEAARLAVLPGALRGWRVGKRDPPELTAARGRLTEAGRALPPLAAELAAAPEAASLAALVGEVERRYAEAKSRAAALDFDDLLLRARDLLLDVPSVRDEVRSRLRALLVDEYQDVNGLQATLFDELAPPLRVAVGDARQSIYRFRGADVKVFASLIERLRSDGGLVVHLRENHRSTAGVVGLVNAVLDADPGALGVPSGPEDRLLAMNAGGDSPAAELLEDGAGGDGEERRDREARAVAARAAEFVAQGRKPGELAVLFRRLTHVGVFERALRRAGLPVRVARGGGFFQAPEVRDLGELCASIEEPGDEVAWASLLRSPLCGLSDGSLVALARRGLSRLAGIAPGAATSELAEARGGAPPEGEGARLERFLHAWRQARQGRRRLDVGELLERAARHLDLEAALLAGPDGERRAGNLRKALALSRREGARGATPADLAERLRRMALRPPREPEADVAEGDAVSVLTVHQAKGLEWPVVFVPELSARPPSATKRPALDEQGRVAVPLYLEEGDGAEETATTARLRAATAAAEAAESRRLLYVALTRAKERLVLSGAEGRSTAGTWADAISGIPETWLVRTSAPPIVPPPAAPHGLEPAGEISTPALRAPPPPQPLRVSVTALAEFARCPLRHWLANRMKLPEPRPDLDGGDDPDRATVRGTLAHALLAEVDLAAPSTGWPVLLEAAAARRGEDPRRPPVRDIVLDLERFLATSVGERLAAAARAGRLRRELPFLLRLDGEPTCYLDGAIDALVVGPGEVEILDFKYARHHPGGEERYRLQLAAYALAAGRAFPGRAVRAVLHYLRPHAEVDVTPSPEALAQLATSAPELALGAVRGDGRDLSPAALGRDEARCRGEGCGYTARCFGTAGPGPA